MTAPRSWRQWQPPPGTKSTPTTRTAVPIGGTLPPAAAPRHPFNKFHAQRTASKIDGTILDSSHEARVYQDLLFRERAGEIARLRRQVRIPLDVNGCRVCEIKVDFVYYDHALARDVYLEAKSPVTRTRQYVITRKL